MKELVMSLRSRCQFAVLVLIVFGHVHCSAVAQGIRQPKGGGAGSSSGGSSSGGSSKLGNYEKPPAANDIPAHPYDVILGRPTDSSIEVRVLHNSDGQGHVDYRITGETLWQSSPTVAVKSGQPLNVSLQQLRTNSQYEYRWVFAGETTQPSLTGDIGAFHTQRSPASSFVFSVTADSHLDENSSSEVYQQTLRNALANRPDFHVELGDTFMTGKYMKPEYAYGQYLAQRYYLSTLCSSAPLFFVMGNHDGEVGGRGSISWATTTRKSLFPNPEPDNFYTGNTDAEPGLGLPENYYAWQWADAQFIVLDPFRYTTGRRRGGQNRGGTGEAGQSNWYWTLGEHQYKWLKQELTKPAKYRFIFIHHLVGGAVQNQRGGAEVATLWEWGGRNEQGEMEFDKYRAGWDKPIHQLLVASGASVVFHGHDHLFVKQELDGIVYQEVPQPSHARVGNTRSAGEYGYLSGEIQPSSGYVCVRVAAEETRIDYVRTYLPDHASARQNGEVTFSYTVKPK